MKIDMKYTALFSILLVVIACKKEDPEPEPRLEATYYPQNWTGGWEEVDPQELGWNTGAISDLYDFLDGSNTRGFVVLHNGKIALEHYNGNQLNGQPFERGSNWYWASAGKSLAGFAAAVAEEHGLLDYEQPVSNYLGGGWTSATTQQEDNILVRHLLTMTSGLDEGVANSDCTDPGCLEYLADPDTRWAYHNAPYTLSHDVISNAIGASFEGLVQDSIMGKIGVAGTWFWLGDNHVYFSSARSMARFGLLNLSEGTWNGEEILSAANHTTLVTSSQALNESYGYLYWLNGKSSFRLPGSQLQFNGSLTPSAPADMYAAIGLNSQLMMVVPSLKLVVVRLGEDPSGSEVPVDYPEALWVELNAVLNR